MQVKKAGATIRVILRFDDPDEWEYISTADELLSEIEKAGSKEYRFTITLNHESREILLQAHTYHPELWDTGDYRADLKVTKDGFVSYYPDKTFIEFKLIKPISETEDYVEG